MSEKGETKFPVMRGDLIPLRQAPIREAQVLFRCHSVEVQARIGQDLAGKTCYYPAHVCTFEPMPVEPVNDPIFAREGASGLMKLTVYTPEARDFFQPGAYFLATINRVEER